MIIELIKTHFLPKTSLRYPTGTIDDAIITPMKYDAPRNPILCLDSQSKSHYSTQLFIYCASDVSALYLFFGRFDPHIKSFEQDDQVPSLF